MSASRVSFSSNSFNSHHGRMVAAFKVVEPLGDWRGPIRKAAKRSDFELVCGHFGVTFGDVLESVEYFTATKASVAVDADGRTVITAKGYRDGPAGS